MNILIIGGTRNMGHLLVLALLAQPSAIYWPKKANACSYWKNGNGISWGKLIPA